MEDTKAHSIAMIRANQPLPHQHLKKLPWRDVSLLDKTPATAHGHDEMHHTPSLRPDGARQQRNP